MQFGHQSPRPVDDTLPLSLLQRYASFISTPRAQVPFVITNPHFIYPPFHALKFLGELTRISLHVRRYSNQKDAGPNQGYVKNQNWAQV